MLKRGTSGSGVTVSSLITVLSVSWIETFAKLYVFCLSITSIRPIPSFDQSFPLPHSIYWKCVTMMPSCPLNSKAVKGTLVHLIALFETVLHQEKENPGDQPRGLSLFLCFFDQRINIHTTYDSFHSGRLIDDTMLFTVDGCDQRIVDIFMCNRLECGGLHGLFSHTVG